MDLVNRLIALEEESHIPPCKVGAILNSLDGETKAVLERVMQGKLSNATISKELCDAGYQVGRTTIGIHRSGRCSCGASK